MTRPAASDPSGGGLMQPGKLSYVQIPAVDAQVSANFYEVVFGWTTSGRPEHLSFIDPSGDLIGAWVTGHGISTEPGILPYLSVADIDSAVDRIVAHGGTIAREPYPEGDLQVATFRDPAGNVMGIWQMGAE